MSYPSEMRKVIVVELFAHDRHELAEQAAVAPVAVIDRIAELSDRGSEGHGGDRLVSVAVEVLTGARPQDAPRRTRSPILEMPDALRDLLARTETLDALARGLDSVRHRRGQWGFVVLDASSTPYYIQYTSYPGPGIRAEAVGDAHLPPEAQLDSGSRSALASLGWREPVAHVTDGNWMRMYKTPGREDLSAIADVALATMTTVYGCGPETRYRVEFGSWADEDLAADATGTGLARSP